MLVPIQSALLQQVQEINKLACQLVLPVEINQRSAALMRFTHLHRATEIHRKNRQPLGDEFLDQIAVKASGADVVIDDNSVNDQRLIMVSLKFGDLCQHLYPDLNIYVDAEQKAVEQADLLVLQHPLYWYS